MIQLTVGSRLLRASSSKVPSGCGRTPRSYRSDPGSALLNAANCSGMLQPWSSSCWYTFQLMPAAWSRSAYVVQRYGVGATLLMIGPPRVPAGSIEPVIRIRRLGQVGPNTEQK
jgi:hypothetical protein